MTPQELLRHADSATGWSGSTDLEVSAAYELALAVRALRIGRGEVPRGFKVGFTNRNIWPRYGVHEPIWGTVWDTTLSFCDDGGTLSLQSTCSPRLEPEAVFGFARTPPAGASAQQLFDCLDWVAPGFEVVQSHQNWKFNAADAVADGGLHALLLVGRRQNVRAIAGDVETLQARLAAARISLERGGVVVEDGLGSNVLDGPFQALQHFLRALRACPGAADIQPGDVVTTGTWTDAWPIEPGQEWTARFDAPLSLLQVRFGS